MNAGSLALANDAVLQNSTVTLSGGSLLFATGAVDPALGALAGTTSLALNGISGLTVGGNNASTTYSGVLSGTGALIEAGTGTFTYTNASNSYSAPVTVTGGTLAIGNGDALLRSTVTLAGGTLAFLSTATFPSIGALAGSSNLNLAGIDELTIGGFRADSVTYSGALSGSAPTALIYNGPGTWTLTGNMTGFTGVFECEGGKVVTASNSALPRNASQIAIGLSGTLDLNGIDSFTNSMSVQGTLRLGGASLTGSFNGTGQPVVSIQGTISNGTHRSGPFALTGSGATLSGITTFSDTSVIVKAASNLNNIINGGSLTISTGVTGTDSSGLTNQGSGTITLAAGAAAEFQVFQSYGTVTLVPGSTSASTQLRGSPASPMYFNGGSRTFLGTPQTAMQNGQPTFDAGIDLAAQNAIVAGGLLVNNGYVVDSTNNGMGRATIVADFGALVKGAGYFQDPVITQNGGKYQAGNSPGSASFGHFVLGPGGVDDYVFAIKDATGTAGPAPDVAGHVSGWGLVRAIGPPVIGQGLNGDFTWTATPTDQLTVAIDTLVNPTTVGSDVAGPMADFDPTRSYSWLAAEWAGTYAGPADASALIAATRFDASGFANPIAGTFGWPLDAADHSLSLTYSRTAVPEPGTLALVGLATGGLLRWRSRHREFAY